jgi:hypothetical protein
MRIVDQVAAWCVVVLGLGHSIWTARFPEMNLNALWFLSGGLFLMVVGALNLLRVRYVSASGVRWVCVASNVAALAFVLAIAHLISLRANPQAIVALVAVALLTIFSLRRPERA